LNKKSTATSRLAVSRLGNTRPVVIPDCLAKIKAYFRSLNAAEKKVAKYILESPDNVLNMTISEVAAESSVSESTVFKLCRTLDFNGFRDFKIALARQYQGPDTFSIADEPVKRSDSAESIAYKAFGFSIDALNNSLKTLDYTELEQAYTALKNAQKVLVISIGISRTTSIFAADKFSFFGIDAVAATDAHVQAMRASLLTPRDVLFAFSRSGDTRDIIETVKIAKDKGATIIGVTNNPRSYFAKLLDIRLLVESKDSKFRWDVLASRIEHFCVVDTLYIMLAARGPKRASACFENIQHAAAIKQF
jgi:RpiR family transcriptional regulator, carbohydrate utilization regulator